MHKHKVRKVVSGHQGQEWRKAKSAEAGICIRFSCRDNSSFILNILGLLCLWQCFYVAMAKNFCLLFLVHHILCKFVIYVALRFIAYSIRSVLLQPSCLPPSQTNVTTRHHHVLVAHRNLRNPSLSANGKWGRFKV